MKPILLLFKSHKAWPGRCLSLFLLVGGLLLTGQVRAQLYSTTYDINVPALRYLDLATQTWTNKAAPPLSVGQLATYQGKIYATAGWSEKFYVYDPVANTWTEKASRPVTGMYGGSLVVAGAYIYNVANVSSIGNVFYRYNITNNTWTQMTAPSVYGGAMAYDGGDYIYCASGSGSLLRYSIASNLWTNIPKPTTPTNILYMGIAFKNGKLYLTDYNNTAFYSYDPTTGTYASLAAPPVKDITLAVGDGNYLYSGTHSLYSGTTSNVTHRYDISTNTWTNLPVTNTTSLVYVAPPCSVTGTVAAVQATCANLGGANADAALTLSTYGGGATKVGYSAGSGYTGVDFATATAVTTAPMTLLNNLSNPASDQPYTIRVFKDATCYKDIAVVLKHQICLTSDIRVSVSPLSQSAASGEMQTYVVTVINAGPDPSDVKIKVPIPVNRTLLSASPQQGAYTESTYIWNVGNLAVGSKTLTLTIKVN